MGSRSYEWSLILLLTCKELVLLTDGRSTRWWVWPRKRRGFRQAGPKTNITQVEFTFWTVIHFSQWICCSSLAIITMPGPTYIRIDRQRVAKMQGVGGMEWVCFGRSLETLGAHVKTAAREPTRVIELGIYLQGAYGAVFKIFLSLFLNQSVLMQMMFGAFKTLITNILITLLTMVQQPQFITMSPFFITDFTRPALVMSILNTWIYGIEGVATVLVESVTPFSFKAVGTKINITSKIK